jgi:hypothetical protein
LIVFHASPPHAPKIIYIYVFKTTSIFPITMRDNKEIDVINYRDTHKHRVVTTRFNTETKMENDAYCRTLSDKSIRCIYSSCTIVDGKLVKPRDVMFVLEMNNDTNTIMGIGMVRNIVPTECNMHPIYKTVKHNVFAYIGKHRIDRREMTEQEEKIMGALDIMCFTGSRHQKRSQGLTMFPICMMQKCKSKGEYGLNIDITNFIGNMFSTRYFSETSKKE